MPAAAAAWLMSFVGAPHDPVREGHTHVPLPLPAGLAYAMAELDQLAVTTMSAEELQRYADVVTHAYPDAVFRQAALDCDALPIDSLNNTSLANVAYVSLHAVLPESRAQAAACLQRLLSASSRATRLPSRLARAPTSGTPHRRRGGPHTQRLAQADTHVRGYHAREV